MKLNHIYNESCLDTMKRFKHKISLVITSPPYNNSRKCGDKYNLKYNSFNDNLSYKDYIKFTKKVFDGYDRVLKRNGVVLYNISYASEQPNLLWLLLSYIIRKTNFTIADCIIWKKKTAIPNNSSKNKLTRICEFVFVLCRKDEYETYNTNKQVVSKSDKEQSFYENVFNYIEADNNDGVNPYNRATFSKQLVKKLLSMYYVGGVVYDSFMGIGTTAKVCFLKGIDYVGSEIDEEQVRYFKKWKKKQSNTTF